MLNLNPRELNKILAKTEELARLEAKAAGTFTVYEINGKLIREYANGKKYEIIRDQHGFRKEIEYHG